jgi:translation initiation factor IF-1
MQRSDAVQVEAVIVALLARRVFRMELGNGHRFLGFAPSWLKNAGLKLAIGDRVKVRISLFDLSKGRLILNDND